MKKKRLLALVLSLLLLGGCAFRAVTPTPTPEPTPAPTALTWLHGFYANSSYGQIALADEMDAVSLGWARLRLDEGGPWVSTTRENGNEWVVPKDPHLATDYLDARAIPYNLCVYASASPRVELAGQEVDVLATAISPEYRERTVAALVAAAEGYSGLTIDFEGLREGQKADFSAFMEELREALPEGRLLYAAVPPDRWYKGYDYRAIGAVCDKVILMAHDYQWTQAPEANLGTAYTDTPIAPIGQVAEALSGFTDPDTGVGDLSKAAIAVAFSCAGVEVDEDGLLLTTRVYNPGTATLTRRLLQEDAQVGWSEEYQAPYVFYHDEEGRRYRVWYENEASVKAKVELAYQYGVTGLSLWRLGTVPAEESYDVWSVVLGELEG